MLGLFTLAIFSGALLLFLVQPMVAKMILPMLGGTPGVWNTCMVFFQAMLLAGYTYAHALGQLRSPRLQVIIHAVVVLALGLLLPIAVPTGEAWRPPTEQTPVWWTLMVLGMAAGGPFFAIASTGPLLQRWFSRTDHRQARDPYFLYAASNAGSMIALIAYPTLIEPALGVRAQSWGWAGMYVLQAGLLIACGLAMLGRLAPVAASDRVAARSAAPAGRRWGERARWLALSAVPSSLLLGTTTYLTLDVAAVPLLWIIPLAVYLLTFILAFGPGGPRLGRAAGWMLPVPVLAVAVAGVQDWRDPIVWLFGLHVGTLFLAALAMHGRLSAERPPTDRLTEFYLLLALGGVLGGIFNALLAPIIFTRLLEYPLALVAALLLLPRNRQHDPSIPDWRWRLTGVLDIGIPAGIAALLLGAHLRWFDYWSIVPAISQAGKALNLDWSPASWNTLLTWAIPASLAVLVIADRGRFALAAAVLLFLPKFVAAFSPSLLYNERTFFTTLSVTRENPSRPVHYFYHGRIVHGEQQDFTGSAQPTSYFSRPGPVGDVFTFRETQPDTLRRVAVLGMGAAVLATYGREGEAIDFYEIDPGVVRIAQNPDLFTYYRDSKAAMRTILGDGRLTLARAPEAYYDLIFLDAFSSDAVPLHLLTREAIEGYLQRLAPGGVIMFNITNRYVRLDGPLARLARELNLTAIQRLDSSVNAERRRQGHQTSEWIAMARADEAEQAFGPLLTDERWTRPKEPPNARLWTDDYANILSVFRWRASPPASEPTAGKAEPNG